MALVFACLSFTPSLLPRSAAFQGLVTGVNAALGYGLGVLCAWLWRELADRPARAPSRRSWLILVVVAAGTSTVSLIAGTIWQRESSRLIGVPPGGFLASLLIPVVAVLLFVALVAVARSFRTAFRKLAGVLERRTSRRAARAIGLVGLVVGTALLLSGVLWSGIVDVLDRSASLADRLTPEDAVQPTTPLRSGGPDSLIDWDSLGYQGRGFVGTGPTAQEISDFNRSPALEPIRIYSGFGSADDVEARADLAVRDLERAGGFERANLLVVTTTGTGWVEPSSAGSFEYLTGGDSAIVAMQYSHLPSWLSYLTDQQRARDAGRALFDAVYDRWSQLPPESRPKLYAFGESLGSFGTEAAFSGEVDMANRLSGALFVGAPSFDPRFRFFLDHRDPGSPEIEAIYREGRTVRFSNLPRASIPPDTAWPGSRVLYLQYPSDPVTWWTPQLALNRPDWLEEPRGSDVSPHMTWIPFVTFWQVSADLALGFSTPPGHGHVYTGDHVDGWAAILDPPGWTEDKADRLREIILAENS